MLIATVILSNQENRSLSYYPEMVALEVLILFVYTAIMVAIIAKEHL